MDMQDKDQKFNDLMKELLKPDSGLIVRREDGSFHPLRPGEEVRVFSGQAERVLEALQQMTPEQRRQVAAYKKRQDAERRMQDLLAKFERKPMRFISFGLFVSCGFLLGLYQLFGN